MRIVYRYLSDDGKEFHSEKDCLDYERNREAVAAVNDMWQKGASLFDCIEMLKASSNYYFDEELVHHENSLQQINHEFKFRIQHWQCCETPAYTLSYFEALAYGISLYIGGSGSWSGQHYGKNTSIKECLTYFQDTMKFLYPSKF